METVRRVAINGCDPQLLRAVKIGGKLTCVSDAIHRGIWAFDDERLHVSVRPEFSAKVTEHHEPAPLLRWGNGPVPVNVTDTVQPLTNLLVHVAHFQPPELAIAVFDSAINKRLTDTDRTRTLHSDPRI